MRTLWARWAVCGLALVIAKPSLADRGDSKLVRRSIAECTGFDQRDRDSEDGVDISVRNGCEIALRCTVSWKLTCAPESKKRRRDLRGAVDFLLPTSAEKSVTASSGSCGYDGWQLSDVQWSCRPE